MTTHPPTERLSAYLDGELSAEEQIALEAHLDSCTECEELLRELRRVLVRAQALEDRAPRNDLWSGVAAAIGAQPRARRRVTMSVPTLLAASLALMLLSGGSVALALRNRGTPPPSGSAAVSPVPAVAPTAVPADVRESRGYDAAVRELQGELAAGRDGLDSTTVRVVEEKLALIDRAIADAERALAADPANAYLHGHLIRTRMRKLDLLRRAAALTRAVS